MTGFGVMSRLLYSCMASFFKNKQVFTEKKIKAYDKKENKMHRDRTVKPIKY